MKTLKLLALAACALLFSQCKTAAPTEPSGTAPSLLEVNTILDSTQIKFIEFANQTNGDAWKAIRLTTSWLLNKSNVKDASFLDSTNITITLQSGLETNFYLDLVDDSGNCLFRGGGPSDEKPLLSGSGTLSQQKIENKKILIFAADTKTLTASKVQIQKTVDRINASGLGLEVTVLKDEQCSYGVVEHFGDYGLVIMDTHGTDNSFLVGSTLDLTDAAKTEDGIKAAINTKTGSGTSDKIVTGKLKLAASLKINPKKPNWQITLVPKVLRSLYFTSDYLDLLPPMPKTIIFGNMCYSGFTVSSYTQPIFGYDTLFEHNGDIIRIIPRGGRTVTVKNPIKPAFLRKNLISYYGYIRDDPSGTSRPVPDSFAADMEDELIKRLVGDNDSTGKIHLKSDNKTENFDPPHIDPALNLNLYGNLYLRHFGADNYSYDKGCIDNFTDLRDGHVYKAVCIGKQTWMAENLDYDLPLSDCYDSLVSKCDKYGKLYPWESVMNGAASSSANPSGVRGICPQGWHVPSKAEWDELITTLGGPLVAGGAMKSKNFWQPPNKGATNSSGFNALPAGEMVYNGATTNFSHSYGSEGFLTWFHTATNPLPDAVNVLKLNSDDATAAWWSYNGHVNPPVHNGNVSCRCLKD